MTDTAPNDDYFDINKFEQLLQRLEGSKGRQQRQKSLEGLGKKDLCVFPRPLIELPLIF